MRVIVFGATGMLGNGILRECLLDGDVEKVLVVSRSKTGAVDSKLTEIIQKDLFQLAELGSALDGYDVCLYALGVSSFRMPEAGYRRLTLDLTVAIARALLMHNPGMKFLFISGAGSDGTCKSSLMWARVKGEAENSILGMGFADAYCFRPGFVQPLHGSMPKVTWIRGIYKVMSAVFPLLQWLAPNRVTTTEELARAMLNVAKRGFPKKVLEVGDFRAAAQ
ncbi:MAG: epimerase [Acidobacteria bacterium]|nr:epimerase [Acidobacteriota bacterium]